MDTKHTPGPWEVNYREDVPTIAIWSCRYGTISPICRIWHAPEGAPPKREIRETDKANAHLIAAAPDLLEALRGLAESVRRMALRLNSEPGNQIAVRLWMDRLEDADAAIAKAEGR